MFFSTRIAANAVLLVASVGAGAAVVQQAPPQHASAPEPAASHAAGPVPAAAAAPASASPSAYRSVFEGYKGLTEQPLQSWRESNDTVGRIGGWQSYAREGQGGPAAGSAAPTAPARTPGPAKAPGASAPASMPADHTGHMTP